MDILAKYALFTLGVFVILAVICGAIDIVIAIRRNWKAISRESAELDADLKRVDEKIRRGARRTSGRIV